MPTPTRINPALCALLAVAVCGGVGWRTAAAPPVGITVPSPPAARPAVLGTISGRVTRDGGAPAAGVTVSAYWAARPFTRFVKDNPNTAETDADGYYTILLRPLRLFSLSGPIVPQAKGYLVTVSNGGGPYVEPPARAADPDARPDRVVTGLDFVLRLGPRITVHARDAITGAPLPGLPVRYGDPFGADKAAGVTGPDGVLRFRVPLTDLRLEADIPPALGGVEAAPGYGAGTHLDREIKAAPGQDAAWDIRTYGATRDADWRGVVLGPDGRPAAGASVTLLRDSFQGGVTTLMTDARGRFSTRQPRLAFEETIKGGPYTLPVVVARRGALAAARAVTPDESWDGMTLRLMPGASIAGTLTDPQGRPAAGVAVDSSGAVLGEPGARLAPPTAITDDRGRFVLDGLPPGEYQVRAHDGGFGDLSVPPAGSDPAVAPPRLPLAAGQRLALGRLTVPRAGRTLAGRVVDAQGRPAPSLYVSVVGAHTHRTAATRTDGTFRVYDAVAEPLTVSVGVPGHEVTAAVAPGQDTVRLVARPDVVATNGLAAPAQPPPPPVPPSGPPTPVLQGGSMPFDGLVLAVSPTAAGPGGAFAAAILRPDSLDAELYVPWFPDASPLPVVWRGVLADLDGMRLAVRRDVGTLSDRAGRVLWRGVVRDPPDYVVTNEWRPPASYAVTVTDGRGRLLWSGPTAPDAPAAASGDGTIRVIGPDHTVAWERVVGNARVERCLSGPGYGAPDVSPEDGTITLHVAAATATLRAAGGRFLWAAPTPVVAVTMRGFPPPPGPAFVGGKLDPAFTTWSLRRMFLLPRPLLSLLSARDAPPSATLTLTDAATGHPLPGGPLSYP